MIIAVYNFAGREEPDTDDQLLADPGLDGSSSALERLGVRGHPSDTSALQQGMAARHYTLQQYSSAVINTNVIVSHTGEVVWLSHGIFRSSCDIDVEYFPFDEQRCVLKWASWTYDGYQLQLEKQSEQGDVSNYQPNGEFDLVNFTAKRNEEYYSCCPEPYPDITYEIRLRRRPMFYVFNLILPCILINGIALLVFYVPSESGEKVTLGISALLSMTVFLMTIRETLPPTEKTPLISKFESAQRLTIASLGRLYYGVSICLVSFASGLAVVTLNIHHRGVRGVRVPTSVKSLVLDKLSRVVFFKFQEEYPQQQQQQQQDGLPKRNNSCPMHGSSSSHREGMRGSSPPSPAAAAYLARRHANNDRSSPNLGSCMGNSQKIACRVS
ncbi:unnamed protein product [Trichogramma brassicae]|uniref:Neurotransmitter-gated ion-channel ligand-binding domain-containing protein n=1 Tax=Trichogramma brassicae TaxID=86971 RepID=A0A6H5J526_9HYME|nr:unnamed protein product [Trichogramma brassicae]